MCSGFPAPPAFQKSLQNSPEILFFCGVFLLCVMRKPAQTRFLPLLSTTQPTSPSHSPGTVWGGRHLVLHPCLVLPFLVAIDMPLPPRTCPGLRWDKETLAAVHGASSALGAVSGSADWLTLSHHSPVSRCRFEPCSKVQTLRRPRPMCEQWAYGTFWAGV